MRNNNCLTILTIWILSFIHCVSLKAFYSYDEDWKKQNDLGNRYEGRKSIEVGAPAIQLIAFYRYQEKFDNDDTLKVKFYILNSSAIYLTAQELEIREFYWMEAKPKQWKPGWNEFSPWPVKDVLGKLDIPPDNLGVLVRLDDNDGSGQISPVILYCQSLPSKITKYKAYFRPSIALSGGIYEIYKGCNEKKEIIERGLIGVQSAGVPFLIIFELKNDWKGLVKFRILVHLKNRITPKPSREYCFYHIPVVNTSK